MTNNVVKYMYINININIKRNVVLNTIHNQ